MTPPPGGTKYWCPVCGVIRDRPKGIHANGDGKMCIASRFSWVKVRLMENGQYEEASDD